MRPYKNVVDLLLGKGKGELYRPRPIQLPSPPPDASSADEVAAVRAAELAQQTADLRAWRNKIMDELAAFDKAIFRNELTTKSNRAERERYAAENAETKTKRQNVQTHIEELKTQLKEARDTLAVRKTYDELTEKITNNKMLKSRDEQAAAHSKLDEEISELQQEVQNSKGTWEERRKQFGRIEEEAKAMLQMIKDEKEEAERKEGMMKDTDENDWDSTAGGASQVGTPMPNAGNGTPMHNSHGDDNEQRLRLPPQDRLASLSRGNSVAPSPGKSGVEDTEMVESGGAKDGDSSMEEGEEEDDGGMDES